MERVPSAAIDEFRIPALAVGLYDVVIAFDHERRAAWLISQGFGGRDELSRRELAAGRLAKFRERLGCNFERSPCPLPESRGFRRDLHLGSLLRSSLPRGGTA